MGKTNFFRSRYLSRSRSLIAPCFVWYLFGGFGNDEWQQSDCCRWTWWRQLPHWNVPIILFHTYYKLLGLEEIGGRIASASLPFRHNESAFYFWYLSTWGLKIFSHIFLLAFLYWTTKKNGTYEKRYFCYRCATFWDPWHICKLFCKRFGRPFCTLVAF